MIVACDHDKAGEEASQAIVAAVGSVVASVRAVRWPGDAPAGYDVTDYLSDPEHGLADLEGLAVAEATPASTTEQAAALHGLHASFRNTSL